MLTQDSLIHATTREIWDVQVPSGSYVPPGFDNEGFIRTATRLANKPQAGECER